MDRSTRNLSIITLIVLSIFLALNHIAAQANLADWWTVLLFLLLAVGIWFYDRVSHRGIDDSEVVETVIEPVSYEHHAAPISIPETVQPVAVSAPAPVIEAAAPVVEPPAPEPVEEKVVAAPAPVVEKQPEPVAVPVEEKVVAAPAPVVEKQPEPVAAPVEAVVSKSAPVTAATGKPDDLKIIEGIGPKMEKALQAAGISTFALLAAASETQINEAIVAAGMRFAPSIPTWAEQASYAAKGDLEGLEAFQKTLKGGRKA